MPSEGWAAQPLLKWPGTGPVYGDPVSQIQLRSSTVEISASSGLWTVSERQICLFGISCQHLPRGSFFFCASPVNIQIVRGLLMGALALGMLGFVLSLLGMECTYIGGKDLSKHRKIYAGGCCHIISGKFLLFFPLSLLPCCSFKTV